MQIYIKKEKRANVSMCVCFCFFFVVVELPSLVYASDGRCSSITSTRAQREKKNNNNKKEKHEVQLSEKRGIKKRKGLILIIVDKMGHSCRVLRSTNKKKQEKKNNGRR